jgi:hypothetical protein
MDCLIYGVEHHFQQYFSNIVVKVVRSNAAHIEVYTMQHYVIKCVSDLRPVGGFLCVLRFPPPIKLTTTV